MWELDTSVKQEIIKARMAKLAQDGYQYELNKKFALHEGNEETAAEYQKAFEAVAKSYDFHEQELKTISAEAVIEDAPTLPVE